MVNTNKQDIYLIWHFLSNPITTIYSRLIRISPQEIFNIVDYLFEVMVWPDEYDEKSYKPFASKYKSIIFFG